MDEFDESQFPAPTRPTSRPRSRLPLLISPVHCEAGHSLRAQALGCLLRPGGVPPPSVS